MSDWRFGTLLANLYLVMMMQNRDNYAMWAFMVLALVTFAMAIRSHLNE